MLDEYSARLLAEMGVDVYVPRSAASVAEPVSATARTAAAQADAPVAVGIVAPPSKHAKLLVDIGLAMRFAGIRNASTEASAVDSMTSMRGLVVLGAPVARAIGASLSAQRQADIEWVIADAPDALAASAVAKRALWGEIKRLARTLARATDGGARR